jgi:glycerophosphoryl diester phosphodiesterase
MLMITGKTKPYLMAHRGNSARCPENTRAAFRQAILDGADIIGTDLHLTADSEFVCIHDATVDRTTNGHGAVAEMTLAQIKNLSASYGRAGFEAEQVPTLRELIDLLPDNMALALELKTDRFLERDVCLQLAETIAPLGDRVVVLSFSLARLYAIQQHTPHLPTGFITLKQLSPRLDVDILGPYWPILLAFLPYVWLAHRKGKFVCPLDIAPDGRLWWYRRLGCDAIMTNDPASTGKKLGRG